LLLAPPLASELCPGVVDEYAPHELRGNGKKLRPILPFRVALARQLDVGLVNQGCGLQGVPGTFLAQALGGHTPKFFIDEWHQLCGRVLVAIAQLIQ